MIAWTVQMWITALSGAILVTGAVAWLGAHS